MIEINTAAIGKLRDRLLETGGPPSMLVTGPEAMQRAQHPLAGDDEALALFQAAFEAMFIMLSADGVIGAEEKDVLRGAIRELTAGSIRSAEIETMQAACHEKLTQEGAPARLSAISAVLGKERMAAEAAFVLAAAMAFADGEIADEENETLNSFAELLQIDEKRANELLDELETT